MSSSAVSSETKALIQDALVWDAHAGIFPDPGVDLSLLKTWRDLDVNYLSINVGFDVMDWQRTLETLLAYRRYILANEDLYVLAETVADIGRARSERKLAVTFDIEGMSALNGNLDMVTLYHALGVRQMLFAYNLNNEAAGGCHDDGMGLSGFGRRVVAEMNRLGMVADCSHVSHRTSLDLIAESTQPVVFSHSNPAAVWPHERNIANDQIGACAETGGVVGINGMGIFLGENDIGEETILRHICHVADLVGPAHIGFGLDFSPPTGIDVSDILKSRPDFWPQGNLYDTKGIKHAGPEAFPSLVEKLAHRGFSEGDVRGILGGNFLRVAAAVWAA